MSLIKYLSERKAGSDELSWGRVQIGEDPYPFRGAPPVMPNAEYDEKANVCRYFQFRFFDINNEEQMKEYTQIMDRCVAGWYILYHQERFVGEKKDKHYLEWIENYMQVPEVKNGNRGA